MMHMSFWFGTDLSNFLFEGLNISSSTGLAVLCVFILASVWLHQALRLALAYAKFSSQRQAPCPDHTTLLHAPNRRSPRWREMCMEGGLYVVELIIGYILMLVVMTYNVWLLLVVVLGSGAAYAAVGHRLTSLTHRAHIIPCSHCLPESSNMHSAGSMSSMAASTTPVSSQVDLVPPPGSCCTTSTSHITASIHL